MPRISGKGRKEPSLSEKISDDSKEISDDSKEISDDSKDIFTDDEDPDLSFIEQGSPDAIKDIYSNQESRDGLKRAPIRRDDSISEGPSSPPPAQPTRAFKSPVVRSPANPDFKHSSPINTNKETVNREEKHSCPKKASEPIVARLHFWCILICIGLLAIILGCLFNDKLLESSTEMSPPHKWNRDILELKKDFPSIKDWKAINVSASKLFSNLQQPGVLLLMGETEESANCFARRLLSYFDVKPLNAKDLLRANPDPADLKDALHYSFHDYLSVGKPLGLLNIHELSGHSAMVFHSYCDNENAPFPSSLIVLSLPFPSNDVFEPQSADQVIEVELIDRWTKNLSFDKASALINRLVGYSAYVPQESVGPCLP